jgi:D-threonate/D-erythronate kinase
MKTSVTPMVRRRVALVADDLTGALDAAAPFADPKSPVAVQLAGAPVPAARGSIAIDAATRGGTPEQAQAAAVRAAPMLRMADTAFRKIDSLLRGHAAAEIAATARAGGFASVIVAPAFPAQGRIMLQGRQYARHSDGAWRLVDRDLMAELGACGLAPRSAIAADLAGGGVFVCDAEFDSDLVAIAAARQRLKPPVLWCGTSGLARALGHGLARPGPLPAGPTLGVVGSPHPVTAAEIAALEAADPAAVIRVTSADAIAGAIGHAAGRLAQGASVLVALALQAQASTDAVVVLHRLAEAAAMLKPASLFASGGDTLAALAQATGTDHLAVTGEAMPGLPLSQFVGGAWDGLAVLSKSGAFGGADILLQLFSGSKEAQRVRA